MATVYRAHQPNVDRFVAVKVIHRSVAADSKALERFTREARLIARLEHPHILPVYDYNGANDPWAATGTQFAGVDQNQQQSNNIVRHSWLSMGKNFSTGGYTVDATGDLARMRGSARAEAARFPQAWNLLESIRHKDRRTNIPTEELRDFVAEDERIDAVALGIAHNVRATDGRRVHFEQEMPRSWGRGGHLAVCHDALVFENRCFHSVKSFSYG